MSELRNGGYSTNELQGISPVFQECDDCHHIELTDGMDSRCPNCGSTNFYAMPEVDEGEETDYEDIECDEGGNGSSGRSLSRLRRLLVRICDERDRDGQLVSCGCLYPSPSNHGSFRIPSVR